MENSYTTTPRNYEILTPHQLRKSFRRLITVKSMDDTAGKMNCVRISNIVMGTNGAHIPKGAGGIASDSPYTPTALNEGAWVDVRARGDTTDGGEGEAAGGMRGLEETGELEVTQER